MREVKHCTELPPSTNVVITLHGLRVHEGQTLAPPSNTPLGRNTAVLYACIAKIIEHNQATLESLTIDGIPGLLRLPRVRHALANCKELSTLRLHRTQLRNEDTNPLCSIIACLEYSLTLDICCPTNIFYFAPLGNEGITSLKVDRTVHSIRNSIEGFLERSHSLRTLHMGGYWEYQPGTLRSFEKLWDEYASDCTKLQEIVLEVMLVPISRLDAFHAELRSCSYISTECGDHIDTPQNFVHIPYHVTH